LGAGNFRSPELVPKNWERSQSQGVGSRSGAGTGKKSEPLPKERAELPNEEPKGAES